MTAVVKKYKKEIDAAAENLCLALMRAYKDEIPADKYIYVEKEVKSAVKGWLNECVEGNDWYINHVIKTGKVKC